MRIIFSWRSRKKNRGREDWAWGREFRKKKNKKRR
jgi:hypothetical protein